MYHRMQPEPQIDCLPILKINFLVLFLLFASSCAHKKPAGDFEIKTVSSIKGRASIHVQSSEINSKFDAYVSVQGSKLRFEAVGPLGNTYFLGIINKDRQLNYIDFDKNKNGSIKNHWHGISVADLPRIFSESILTYPVYTLMKDEDQWAVTTPYGSIAYGDLEEKDGQYFFRRFQAQTQQKDGTFTVTVYWRDYLLNQLSDDSIFTLPQSF